MASTLDLSSLRLVRAIADAGTITGAATSLGFTQPAVSQHVRRLERRLGTALLERHARGVRLTEAGQVLARYGATVAATVAAAEREVSALAGLRAGRVRVMSFPSASATLVPAALLLLRDNAPDVEVDFSEAEPPEATAALREGRCDIAVTFDYTSPDPAAHPPGAPDLDREHPERADHLGVHRVQLMSDASLLAIASGDPLADEPRLHLRDLTDTRWIAGCSPCRTHLTDSAAAAGFAPRIAFETDDYMATLAFVAAGLGVALLPGLVAPVAATYPGVTLRSIAGVGRRAVHALTTTDLLRVPAVAVTIEALQEAAAVQ